MTPMIKRNLEGADDGIVLHLVEELHFVIQLEADDDRALLDEGYIGHLVQLVDDVVEFRVMHWFQRLEDVLHQFAVI